MKIDSKKTIIVIISLLALISLAGGAVYFYSTEDSLSEKQRKELSQNYCLADDEAASYEIKENPLGGGTAEIFVEEKNNNQKKYSFEIEISNPKHYHPVEIHKCGVYVVRTFGYDYGKKIPLENYKRELWVYRYNGKGKSLMSDSSKWSHENILGDFRVDPTEKYVVLEKGYLGKDDYALIIKDIETKEDIFVLPFKEIANKYPDLIGGFRFRGWTKDSKYFWGDIFAGANVLGFFRIDTLNWKTDIFSAPKNTMGGDVLNLNTGYVTVHPNYIYFGIYEVVQAEKEKRRKEGIGSEIYIENLITQERYFVDKTDEPLWFFKPKWISDTELEYYLPSGEKKVYKISDL